MNRKNTRAGGTTVTRPPRRHRGLPRVCLAALLAGLIGVSDLPAQPPENVSDAEFNADLQFAAAVPTGLPRRRTIAPWIVDVYGRNYQDFTNQGASRVISDWLTNALIDLELFTVVNRERIRAVISERNLTISGFARDVSRDVPENELATAGKLLSVNYILLGNVKNLGSSSEVDFKLLDVETTTYSPLFRLNFQIPFNSSIEKFKPVVDRIVAQLAASFPVNAGISGLTASGDLMLMAGSENGLGEGMGAELWHWSGGKPAATGVITEVGPTFAKMALDEPVSIVSVLDYRVKIAVAPGPEAALSSGQLEMSRGNYAKAREILGRGAEEYPGHGRILALHARSCWRLGDYEGAVSSYRLALNAEPNDMDLLEEAAQVLFEAGQFQEVIELLTREEREALTLELELRLGESLALQGYPSQAREAYKRAFRLDPESPLPHLRLGVLAAALGDAGEVERELRLARASGLDSLEAEVAEAVAQGLLSEPPSLADAEPVIERAASAADFAALASACQLFALKPSLWRDGLALAERSVEINPDFLQGHILRSEAYVLGGELESAAAVLQDSLQAHPNSVALLVRSGELLARLGEYEQAELRLLQAMDLAPLQWRAADALGDSRYEQGEFLKAVDAYQRSLRIAEQIESSDLTLRLQKLGRAAVQGQQHATAQPYLERCVEREPDNKECRYYLGLCDFMSNLPQADERAIVNLKASEGFSNDSSYYLGVLYDRREDFEAARDWYQSCVDSGCQHAETSEERVDEIETVRGTIVGQSRGVKEVSLDVGAIHGVLPSQTVTVLHQGKAIAKLRTEQVLEKTSVAKILSGKPRAGHTVTLRPTRPKALRATKAPKKGVKVSWRPTYDPHLAAYVVYRKAGAEPNWEQRKRIGANSSSFVDKSAKAGNSYRYRVVAVSSQGQESVTSRECEIAVE